LARLIALALNLEESFFDQPGLLDKTVSMMRLIHYSAEKSNIEDGVFGAGAHCDWGFFTLLATDDVPGLQICRNKDAVPQVWEDVPPMNGAYIVNLGQMLERWSNGLFRATLHRVIGKGVERYSIPFFFNPNYHSVVECFPTCCSEDNPPKYPPITCGDHIVGLYKQTHKSTLLAIP